MKYSLKIIGYLLMAYLGALGIAQAESTLAHVQLVTEDSWPPYSDVNG